jgi:ELWxxDGT repeat protein
MIGCRAQISQTALLSSSNSVTITNPATPTVLNNQSSLTINGTCKNTQTVHIEGNLNSTTTCSDGAFSFTHSPVADGKFQYNIFQVNSKNVASAGKTISWIRDTLPPDEKEITSPAILPYFSGDDSLIISGLCEIGAVVQLEDTTTQTTECLTGVFTFTASRSLNDTYNLNLMQKDAANNSSAVKQIQWVRDDTLPPTPTLTTPASNYMINNLSTIIIAGGCVTGNTVTISGDHSANTVCANSAYSFTVNKSTDSVYQFGIKQTSLSLIDSAEASVSWVRDTSSPTAPTIVTPGTSPFSSGDTLITISGVCETGATVNLTLDSTSSMICSNSEYSFLVTKNGNTSYNFSVGQTDQAGNVSSSTLLTWNQDTNKPATPLITSPATANALTNSSSINIIGTCNSGNTVYLSGNSTQNMVCTNSAFNFLVTAGTGDGSYSFSINQKSKINNQFSGEASLNWTSDTTPPSAPTLSSVSPISPSSSLTPKVKGTTITGTIIKVYHSQDCSGAEIATGSANDFIGNGVSVTIAANETHDLSVKAFDAAGNASPCSSTHLNYVNRRATLITDLRSTGSDGSAPSGYFPFNGYLYFRAFTPNTGYELYRTDGTPNGTVLFKNFSIQGDGIPTNTSTAYAMNGPYQVGSVFYFAATDDKNGTELWKSDGTAAGTVLVKDINLSGGSSNPNGFVAVGSMLYFKADDGVNGEELWQSDGTDEGTVMVKNINTTEEVGSGITYMTALGPKLIFFANDGINGLEPWVTDGTTNGTQMISNINNTSTSSSPNYLTVMGGHAYFSAAGAKGNELWKTDGTSGGTVCLDLLSGSSSSSPVYLTTIGATLYFRATDGVNGAELWKSDGTLAGSSMIMNINPGSSGSNPLNFRDSGTGFIYFVAISSNYGTELWRTDGTMTGTSLIKDITPVTGSTTFSSTNFNVYNGKLYFTATTTELGSEAWVSDGTETGTFNLKDIYSGRSSSSIVHFTEFNSKIFFTASNFESGTEVYNTDGTSLGTILFKDLNTISSGSPNAFTAFGSRFLMTAVSNDYGRELYLSDGTANGTALIKDINPGNNSSSPTGFFVDDTKAYFTAFDETNGSELWVTDGTPEGTVLVKDINFGASSSSPTSFTKIGTKIVFVPTTDDKGKELWVTDGTENGTTLLVDLYAGASNSNPSYLTVMGDYIYFYAASVTTGYELYRTDGTAAGTTLVKDIIAGSSSGSPSFMTQIGGNKLIFRATTSTSTATGIELWMSDGTASGTQLLKDINPGTSSSTPTNLKALNDKVIFSATTPSEGTELWITDGTSGGTNLLKDIRPGAASSSISQITVIGERAYFQANDGTNGTELWVSDGTPEGTLIVKDIAPGEASSGPIYFTDIGDGVVAFRAQDTVNGWELWRTDGTAENTYLVQDINPFGGAYLSVLFYWNNKLYFQPNDGVIGYEFWSY